MVDLARSVHRYVVAIIIGVILSASLAALPYLSGGLRGTVVKNALNSVPPVSVYATSVVEKLKRLP